MANDLESALSIAASGMRAQGFRLKVVAQNIANASSTADRTGGEPYRRKIVTFANVLDRELDAKLVEIKKVKEDSSQFSLVYNPNHPAANGEGFVEMPNVNALVEMMDMREAQRSYEANLNMIESSKQLMSRTIGLLR
ncbi:MAG: flagellar basal body rod protein FlgC [Alphaproteobacteria bacterium]|jgi:flagellar basal-body rod protein FlgC